MLCLSVVAVSACDITLYPEDTITPGSYFRNETDLQLFTNNFYASVMPSATDIYADEADIIINPALKDEISGQRIIPETGGGWSWTALRQINYYLANSYRCPDEEARKHYDGIARFFRAYFYYTKVARFGDVPWYDVVVGSGDSDLLNKPRDSRKLVMKNVLADLDYAIENISSSKEVYRVTKWAALALKSRVMLFEGTFRKYHVLVTGKSVLTSVLRLLSSLSTREDTSSLQRVTLHMQLSSLLSTLLIQLKRLFLHVTSITLYRFVIQRRITQHLQLQVAPVSQDVLLMHTL